MKSITILLLLLVLCVAAVVAVYETGQRSPQYVQVTASEAFVYPGAQAGEFLLALPQGSYLIKGHLIDGCYMLTKPAIGAKYGTAWWVRKDCEAGK